MKKEMTTLPAITLKGLMVFPNAAVQIVAGREKSIQAINVSQQQYDNMILVFSQLDENLEDPSLNDIHQYGSLCRIISTSSREDQNINCYLKGVERVKIEDFVETKDLYYQASATTVVNTKKDSDKDLQEHLTTLHSCFNHAVDRQAEIVSDIVDKEVSQDVITRIKECDDLEILTDLLAQVLNLDVADKRLLLETCNPISRASQLISTINHFNYKSEVLQKVVDQARENMEKHQREYYLSEQLKVIKRELNISADQQSEVEIYRQRLATEDLPAAVKKRLEIEINKLVNGGHGSETSVVRNYIDTLFSIPWNKLSEVNKDLSAAKDVLEHDHYGLDKVKDRILEYLAVQSRQDKLHGPILCLMGPPGIGKTSLGASIAKATGRQYVRIALGGLHDEAEIRGHRRTYIGALPGKIIQQIIKCGVKNPLLLLDEIDKVSDANRGDPASALLEVLDPEQNKAFMDNYVDLDFDLSNVMFLATANSYNIEKPLLDRMEVIDLSSYTEDEKFHIAKEHLIKKQMEVNTLSEDEFEISDAALRELIVYYTHEAGVRGLERLINELCRKCVKELLLSKSKKKKKIIIDEKAVNKHLGPRRYDFTSKLTESKVGIVNGLAYTPLGGDILQLEALAIEGSGKSHLTGKLGEVMKESISAALTVVRSRATELGLDPNFNNRLDLHIHVPEGATPKEGPSAGIGMCTVIASALTGNEVRSDVAMTGEITLRGDVLPIGGLKEKLLAAIRGGIKIALIPHENEKDLYDLPKIIGEKLKIIPVKKIDEVLKLALVHDPFKFKVKTAFSKEKGEELERKRNEKATTAATKTTTSSTRKKSSVKSEK